MWAGVRRAAILAAPLFRGAILAAPPFRGVVVAALLFPGAGSAQDVTLISREGSIEISGTLLGYNGEFYRLDTSYGPLTVDAEGVICEGPACPELIAPRAVIRLAGEAGAGLRLLPALFAAFAGTRGLVLAERPAAPGQAWAAEIRDPAGGQILGELSFAAAGPDAAREALAAGGADLVLSARDDPGTRSRALALDILVPVVAPGNPTPRVSTVDLARALKGELRNWSALGGPDMPIVLHALDGTTDPGRALARRLGIDPRADITHPDAAALAAAVAADPWALAVTLRSQAGAAVPLPLTDSCGFALPADLPAAKAQDYPLTLPLLLLTPPRRLPLLAREFLEFIATPAADAAVAAAGLVDGSVERRPLMADSQRLFNAIRGAEGAEGLAGLQRLAAAMEGADRLSLTFRFRDDTAELDAASRENLVRLAALLAAGQFPAQRLILAGFTDGRGEAAANLALSRARAGKLRDELAALVSDAGVALPEAEGFGEALPIACDETATGRWLNRRVELWSRPDFTLP